MSLKFCVLMPAALRLLEPQRRVVKGNDIGAAGDQRARRQQAGAAEAEDRDLLPAKVVIGIKNYLNFSEASPASASTTATIQKRITICGSVQPFCS